MASGEHAVPTIAHRSPAWEPYQSRSLPSSVASKLGLKKQIGIAGSTRQIADVDGMTSELNKESSSNFVTTAYAPVDATPTTLLQRFDRLIPKSRHYLGHSRRSFLVALLIAFICLLALILGLAIGLTRKGGQSSTNLPLPDNKSIFTGDLTYYDNYLGLGSCGTLSASSDFICAVSHVLYDAASISGNPNDNPLCGQMIRVTKYDSGIGTNSSVDVKVVDRCVGCAATDLDLSLGAFKRVADEAAGRVICSWTWLS